MQPSLARSGRSPYFMDPKASAVLHALLYFDVFMCPLRADEVMEYSNASFSGAQEVESLLAYMMKEGMVRKQGELYSVNMEDDVFSKRISGNQQAARYLLTAKRISRFIALFPFVRGVMISGSLSKGFMDRNSDIDYFIVTEKGRLWICRTLLAAFRKVLPGRAKKYFCINYFIDNEQLEIPEKNIFTATEVAFIHPTYNPGLYAQFLEANQWVSSSYYPNKRFHAASAIYRKNIFLPRLIAELLLSGKLGSIADNRLHRFMKQRWEKKFANDHLREEFELNFRTRKNASKQHEKGHQAKILNMYASNILAFESKHGVTLSE